MIPEYRSFVDSVTGSSHSAHLLMKQQQQQQCGPASRSEMESLIAELVASIAAASCTNSDADRNTVDVHVMTTACAALDHLTIIGCPCISAVTVRFLTCVCQVDLFAREEWLLC